MQTTLQDMPLRIGDPGLFLCSRDDLEPWRKGLRKLEQLRAPAPAPPYGVWLVLAGCKRCRYKTRYYCRAHDGTGITP